MGKMGNLNKSWKKELKSYAKTYQDELSSFIAEEITESELIEVMEKAGIKDVSLIISEILDNHLLVDEYDRCFECHNIIKDEDLTTEQNPCPYGDTTAYQTLVDGYECSVCGHSEKY